MSACEKHKAKFAPRYFPTDCTAGVYVQYGWVAYMAADPDSVSPNFWAWGTGWGSTEQKAASNAYKSCSPLGKKASCSSGEAATIGSTGGQTNGGFWSNPPMQAIVNAAAWSKDNPSNNKYQKKCETYVEAMYADTGEKWTFLDAYSDYIWELKNGRINPDTNAPAGALVFFTGNPKENTCTENPGDRCGHVGLATGDGETYWTSDTVPPSIQPYSEGCPAGISPCYLGWAYPKPIAIAP